VSDIGKYKILFVIKYVYKRIGDLYMEI